MDCASFSSQFERAQSTGRRGELLDKRREMRALVPHEYPDEFRGLVVARICRHQVHRSGRLEEGLPNLEGFDGATSKLRADFSLGDVSGDRAAMAMSARKSARTIEHAHDGHALAGYIRQGVRGDWLDGVEAGARLMADRAQRLDDPGNSVDRDRQGFSDQQRTDEACDSSGTHLPSLRPARDRGTSGERHDRYAGH